jgi:cytochrome c oxidase assembly protein subunit 15
MTQSPVPPEPAGAGASSSFQKRGRRARTQAERNRWLRWFAYFSCASTLFLIFMGALVKSHDAGLSVPDWPQSFGRNMFLLPPSEWIGSEHMGVGAEGGVFWEHSHRLIASFVGMLVLVLCVWLTIRERRLGVLLLGFGALVLVIAQGVLGGLTVLMKLPVAVSVMHGVTAQTFLVVMIALAYLLSREWFRRKEHVAQENTAPVLRWGLVLFAAVYTQLVIAAIMRHWGAGMAIPDFPTTAGRWLPILSQEALAWSNDWRAAVSRELGLGFAPVTMGQMAIHLAHRVMALVIVVLCAVLTVKVFRHTRGNRRLRSAVLLVDVLVVAQAKLGMFVVWTMLGPIITSLHVVMGAAVLAVTALTVLRAWPVEPRVPTADEAMPEAA